MLSDEFEESDVDGVEKEVVLLKNEDLAPNIHRVKNPLVSQDNLAILQKANAASGRLRFFMHQGEGDVAGPLKEKVTGIRVA